MSATRVLVPDEAITADGVRVPLNRHRPSGTRAVLLSLAAAPVLVPVVVPVVAAGAMAVMGLGLAAASAGVLRAAWGVPAPPPGAGATWSGWQVTVVLVEAPGAYRR